MESEGLTVAELIELLQGLPAEQKTRPAILADDSGDSRYILAIDPTGYEGVMIERGNFVKYPDPRA